MAEHVKEWLGAYLDGELRGSRLLEVEAHLKTCEACRNELKDFEALSQLLHEDTSLEGFTPADRFAANLALQLPRRPEVHQQRRSSRAAWWLVPAGITAAWVFVQTLLLVSGAFHIFNRAGLIDGLSAWLPEGIQHTVVFRTSMSLFGEQVGESGQSLLTNIDQAYLFGKSFLSPFILQACLVLVYWIWLLFWFLRRNRQQLVFFGKPSKT